MKQDRLEGLQLEFQRELLGEPSAFAGAVRRGGALDAQSRMAIYRQAYRARLVEALRDLHGHAARYLGEDTFSRLGEEFVAANPSSNANLRVYGEGFAHWLSLRLRARPEVAELAALDRALRAAFDGPDAPVLALGDLARVPPGGWGRVAFALQPTYARRRFMHNTLALWQAIDHDEPLPPVAALEHPVDVVIWRAGLRPHFRSLGDLEAAALDGLHAGASFAAVCGRLAEEFPQADIAREAGTLLRRWIDEELLRGLILDREPDVASPSSATKCLQMISK